MKQQNRVRKNATINQANFKPEVPNPIANRPPSYAIQLIEYGRFTEIVGEIEVDSLEFKAIQNQGTLDRDIKYKRVLRYALLAMLDEDNRFDKMSGPELATYAFDHELEGFKARHSLWNRQRR